MPFEMRDSLPGAGLASAPAASQPSVVGSWAHQFLLELRVDCGIFTICQQTKLGLQIVIQFLKGNRQNQSG